MIKTCRLGAAAAVLLALAGPAMAAPSILTFDGLTPVTYAPGTGGAVGGGYQLQVSSTPANGSVVIDDAAPGGLADGLCSGGCGNNATNAVYSFFSAGFSITLSGGGTFTASAFDAVSGSNGLSKATRFTVSGARGSDYFIAQSFLLLPTGYTDTRPADAAAGFGETFQSLALIDFVDIDTLYFTYASALTSDPVALTDDTGFTTDFVIDNIVLDATPTTTTNTPEPASAAVLAAGLLGLCRLRRRKG